MQKIAPAKVRYIKLGRGGSREAESIAAGTLWLSYQHVRHHLCQKGGWEAVHNHFVENQGDSPTTATNHTRQVKTFYEAGEDVLWVTFHANRLWWGFAKPDITLLDDNSKTRPIIGGWRSTDVNDEPLVKSKLSGQLLSMEGYRGTICKVRAEKYLIRKINGETSLQEQALMDAREQLAVAVEDIIDRLHWKDFELLVDLIFRAAGWQRIGEVGGAQVAIDLQLTSPILGESYAVQIKSSARLQGFQRYPEQTKYMDQFTRHYFVVHEPKSLTPNLDDWRYELWLPDKIADLAIRHGLVDWIADKAI
jgi:hypothetical protein